MFEFVFKDDVIEVDDGRVTFVFAFIVVVFFVLFLGFVDVFFIVSEIVNI